VLRVVKLDMNREADIQRAVFMWSKQPAVRAQYPELALLHHIKNETVGDAKQIAVDKAEGVKKGVPDLCLPVPRGGYHGLYIELKTAKGRATDEQKWWLLKLSLQGYKAVLCKGYEAAVKEILKYMEG